MFIITSYISSLLLNLIEHRNDWNIWTKPARYSDDVGHKLLDLRCLSSYPPGHQWRNGILNNLSLGHIPELRLFKIPFRPQLSINGWKRAMSNFDAVEGSGPIQNSLFSARVSNFLHCMHVASQDWSRASCTILCNAHEMTSIESEDLSSNGILKLTDHQVFWVATFAHTIGTLGFKEQKKLPVIRLGGKRCGSVTACWWNQMCCSVEGSKYCFHWYPNIACPGHQDSWIQPGT